MIHTVYEYLQVHLQNMAILGEYHSLVNEMWLVDHQSIYRYFHVSPDRFSHLFGLVGPALTQNMTNVRAPISPGERLAITLRYLVNADAMQTISFNYRVGHSTVCGIICMWNMSICLTKR